MKKEFKEKKFINFYENNEYEILTDEGFQDFKGIHETIPYEKYYLKTLNFFLECADMHKVFLKNGQSIFVKDLIPGQLIQVESFKNSQSETVNFDEVVSVKNICKFENMFDVELSDKNKFKFYSNGILSHNTKFSEILSGILTHDVGHRHKEKRVELTGEVLIGVNQQPTQIGRIGVVQQQYPLLEHRSVLGNLSVIAYNRFKTKDEADDKVEKTLNMLNLQNHKNYYPANLSGGQKQRLAIGQALINCEDFIIFDEPFSGLDINMISRVLDMLRELTNNNELLTIIVISHDITATTAISDTLWLMGKEKDEQGNFIPGARILNQIDLMERGLAWTPDITLKPEFSETTREIRGIFPNLA